MRCLLALFPCDLSRRRSTETAKTKATELWWLEVPEKEEKRWPTTRLSNVTGAEQPNRNRTRPGGDWDTKEPRWIFYGRRNNQGKRENGDSKEIALGFCIVWRAKDRVAVRIRPWLAMGQWKVYGVRSIRKDYWGRRLGSLLYMAAGHDTGASGVRLSEHSPALLPGIACRRGFLAVDVAVCSCMCLFSSFISHFRVVC